MDEIECSINDPLRELYRQRKMCGVEFKKLAVVASITGFAAVVCERLGTANLNESGDLVLGIGLIGVSKVLGIATAGCGIMALCKGVFFFRYDKRIKLVEMSRKRQ